MLESCQPLSCAILLDIAQPQLLIQNLILFPLAGWGSSCVRAVPLLSFYLIIILIFCFIYNWLIDWFLNERRSFSAFDVKSCAEGMARINTINRLDWFRRKGAGGGRGGGGERGRKGLGFPELHLVFIIDSMRADSEPLEISTRLMHYYIIISGRINSLPAFLFFFFLLPNQCKNIPGCININRVIKMP